jgi:hypothetical protein
VANKRNNNWDGGFLVQSKSAEMGVVIGFHGIANSNPNVQDTQEFSEKGKSWFTINRTPGVHQNHRMFGGKVGPIHFEDLCEEAR